MRKIIIQVMCLCTLLIAVSANSAPFELKGLELGKPATREQIKSTIGLFCSPECETGRGCNISCGSGATFVAGVYAETGIALDEGHTVQKITASFETAAFDVISAAFVAKYGNPTRVDHSVITTGAGGKFDQTINVWRNDTGDEISLSRFSRDVRYGTLKLRTKAEIDRSAAKVMDQQKDI